MLKKRSLLIISTTILLLIVGVTFAVRNELPAIYAVCRSEMLSIDGYGPWIYQRTSLFPLPIDVIFEDEVNTADCQVRRNGSEWQVTHVWHTIVGCLDCPEGKFGVIP